MTRRKSVNALRRQVLFRLKCVWIALSYRLPSIMPRKISNLMIPVFEDQACAMIAPVWTSCGVTANAAVPGIKPYGRGRWCGACRSVGRRLCSDDCEVTVAGEAWCGLCVGVAGQFCAMDCYRERLLNPLAYIGFYRRSLPTYGANPCSWCAGSAGCWCESCDQGPGPATALCHQCDDSLVACRLCWADNYVRERGRVRAPPDAARRYADYKVCAGCGDSGDKKCGRCKTVHYCSESCQLNDWERHRPVCSMLRKPIKVLWVYPWQEPRVRALRDWATLKGTAVEKRFYRCFGEENLAFGSG